jgi:nicotinate-nucleotide pyrophosphorylase
MNNSTSNDAIVGATILAAGSLVVGGQDRVDDAFSSQDDSAVVDSAAVDSIIVDWYIGDGERAEVDDVICKLVGPLHALKAGEESAMRFLQSLSTAQTSVDAPLFSMRYKID